jgi:hypothetical protein
MLKLQRPKEGEEMAAVAKVTTESEAMTVTDIGKEIRRIADLRMTLPPGEEDLALAKELAELYREARRRQQLWEL